MNMNLNDLMGDSAYNTANGGYFTSELFQEIPTVVKKELDRIDVNAKTQSEIIQGVQKDIDESNPYSLENFKHMADNITFSSYWHGGSFATYFYWRGNIGNIFETVEEIEGATNQGDVRIFFGIPFYAANVHTNETNKKVGWFGKQRSYWKTDIKWTIPNATDRWIAEFKHKLFR